MPYMRTDLQKIMGHEFSDEKIQYLVYQMLKGLKVGGSGEMTTRLGHQQIQWLTAAPLRVDLALCQLWADHNNPPLPALSWKTWGFYCVHWQQVIAIELLLIQHTSIKITVLSHQVLKLQQLKLMMVSPWQRLRHWLAKTLSKALHRKKGAGIKRDSAEIPT